MSYVSRVGLEGLEISEGVRGAVQRRWEPVVLESPSQIIHSCRVASTETKMNKIKRGILLERYDRELPGISLVRVFFIIKDTRIVKGLK